MCTSYARLFTCDVHFKCSENALFVNFNSDATVINILSVDSFVFCQQIYMNTTSMIAHEIANNFTSRPDLALTYYPSKYEFYWFVSRTYAYLNRFYVRGTVSKVDPRLYVVNMCSSSL